MKKRPFAFILGWMIVLFFIGVSSQLEAQKLASGYINAGDTRIYIEGGGRGSTLIFVHAGFQDIRMWKNQVQAFLKDHQVILIDLPGHGQTIDGTKSLLAEDIIHAVMDSLNILKASFVGLSLGGAVVTDFAIAYPSRVEKLVLASSGLTGWDEGRPANPVTKLYSEQLDSAFIAKDTATAAEVFTHYWYDGVDRKLNEIDTNQRKQVLASTYYTMKQHHASGTPRFASPTAINKLAAIKVPVLIITGSADLPELLQMNAYLAKNLPNARQVIMDGAGHMINLERPQKFNEEVRKFLEVGNP